MNDILLTRRRLLVSLTATGLTLAGCAALGPPPVEISEARLLEAFGKRFPLQLRWLDTLDIAAVSPRLRLLPESNRLATEVDIVAARALFGRPLRGTLGMSSGLRFESSDGSVRLEQVQVERIDLPGWPGVQQGPGGRLVTALAEEMLRDFTVYRLKPEEAALLQRSGLVPRLQVQRGGVRIDFERAR